MDYPGSGQEYDYRRDKRNDRVKDRHGMSLEISQTLSPLSQKGRDAQKSLLQ